MTAAALDRSVSPSEKESGIKRLARSLDESASSASGLPSVPTKLQPTVKELAGAVTDLATVLSCDPRGYRAVIPVAGSPFDTRSMNNRSGSGSGTVVGTESLGLANADGSAVEKATVTVQ